MRICPFISPACTNGLFGQDCSENCNGTCAGCNHVSGVCDSGCVSGWMGHSCNQSIVYTVVWIIIIIIMIIIIRYMETLYQWYLQNMNCLSWKSHRSVFFKTSMFVNCIICNGNRYSILITLKLPRNKMNLHPYIKHIKKK